MLLNQLSDDDKRTFMEVAELLCLADRPVLWGGKRRHEITASTNISDVSLEKSESASEALDNLSRMLRSGFPIFRRAGAERGLIKRIETMPLDVVEEPAARATAATEVLREQLKDKSAAVPSVPKLMLYELMMLALRDGAISSVQWQLLSEFKHHFHVEEHIADELLERAKTTYSEAQKTIALILE